MLHSTDDGPLEGTQPLVDIKIKLRALTVTASAIVPPKNDNFKAKERNEEISS